jgi:hypothetical protein
MSEMTNSTREAARRIGVTETARRKAEDHSISEAYLCMWLT